MYIIIIYIIPLVCYSNLNLSIYLAKRIIRKRNLAFTILLHVNPFEHN